MACKIYRIGLFFDGTGNNKDFDTSNGRDQQSNIAKLFNLYRTGEFECGESGCKVEANSIYIRGIGTYDTQDEYDDHPIARKYDKGGGGGGAKRIEEAIDQVTKLLNDHQFHTSDDSKFATRVIDLFGFSRGAATARDFVNTFYRFKNKTHPDVRFNFIGLFDTVGSFGEPGNPVDYKPKQEFLNQRGIDEDYLPDGMKLFDENYGIRDPKRGDKIRFNLGYSVGKDDARKKAQLYRELGWSDVRLEYIGESAYRIVGVKDALEVFEPYNFNLSNRSAGHIIHMTAYHEVRKNFPLTDIRGSGGYESVMVGVHSDIGGGYSPVKYERHRFSYSGHPRGVKAAAKEHAKRLNQETKGHWIVESAVCGRNYKGHYILQRRVYNDLSNVTLHLMHEEALKFRVPFKPLPQDENHAILPHLEEYYSYARENMKRAYTYSDTEDGRYLIATQVHHSAVDPAGIDTHYIGDTRLIEDKWKNDSADGGGNDARYLDRSGRVVDGREYPHLAHRTEREIYPNNPDKAVDPKKPKNGAIALKGGTTIM